MILYTDKSISLFKEAIYQAVAYADIFDYPLTVAEIHRYLPGFVAGQVEVDEVLQHEKKLLDLEDGYYTLPGRTALADIRRQREKNATRLWPQAIQYGKLISRLPFVRLMAVTGALAMNNVENSADIDFLIVTEPGHLWLTRAQILLLGRFSSLHGIKLCPNYLVSQHALVFPDRTLYAAHELAQMIPLAGLDMYEVIRKQNPWVLDFLPNAAGAPSTPFLQPQPVPRFLSRPALEAMMRTPPARWLENWEMGRKIPLLRREQSISPESTFSSDVCKGHFHRHQSFTNQALEERLRVLDSV